MKKLTEYKELEAATLDNTRLPIKNCVCLDSGGIRVYTEPKNTIVGTVFFGGDLYFQTKSRGIWPRAAEIITRYPRDVPEGVTPLPEDKPFLAYLDLRNYDINLELDISCYINAVTDEWVPLNEGPTMPVHVAIDVSTQWAKEKFPEIVEAMEYERVYTIKFGGKKWIGHRLGDRFYDLRWNPIRDIDLTNEPNCDPKGAEGDSQNEPPDFEPWIMSQLTEGQAFVSEHHDEKLADFNAGKARGKWEAITHAQAPFKSLHNWKYETARDAYLKVGSPITYNQFCEVFELARELDRENRSDDA